MFYPLWSVLMPKKITSPLLTGNKHRDRERLRILLVKNNTSPTEIAAALGISSQAVSRVIHRRDNSRTVFEYLENLPIQVGD
jgi:IS30 family transposase